MPTVVDALRQHGPAYVRQFGPQMPIQHKRVLSLLTKCRTGELGHLRFVCDSCPKQHWVGRSCSNRHCPNCQHDKTQKWLADRMAELLPVTYFMVTFTVPESLRKVVRANQDVCYKALFECGSQTLRELAAGKRFIGTDRMGFFGALHTWGRDFTVYNPHVHFVVLGGGVSEDGSKWQACPANFLLPEKAASTVFRAKFRDAIRAADLQADAAAEERRVQSDSDAPHRRILLPSSTDSPRHRLPRRPRLEAECLAADPTAWSRKWVMDVEAVGNGEAVLKYLAPYVYRVAISNNRIEDVDETSVEFRYTPSGTKTVKRRRVSGQEFVRGFLQHTLPPNFHRIRYYGFLSPNSKLSMDRVRMLVWFYLGWCYVLAKRHIPPPPQIPPLQCRECGGTLHLVEMTDQHGCVLFCRPLPDHSLAYLDSG